MFEAHGMGKVRVKIDIQKVCTLSAMAGHTLVVAGDSLTADSNFTNGNPKASWARALEKYMKSGCTIDNHAKGGASTKSFIVSGRWAETVKAVKPGDYVLIQFGGNDQKWHTPFYLEKRFADHKTTFRDNIRKFVKEVREKGGKPVLVSESVRATFDENGKLFDKVDKKGISLACYATAMREMSEELKTEFVDMNRLTHDLLAKLGKEGAHKLYVISTGWIDPKTGKPSTDTNHTIKAGAEAYAKLFYEDVKKRNLDIAELFN
jgi:pectinesterase